MATIRRTCGDTGTMPNIKPAVCAEYGRENKLTTLALPSVQNQRDTDTYARFTATSRFRLVTERKVGLVG
jgi:hypothetical protein